MEDQSIIRSRLQDIAAQVIAADPADKEALIRIGAALEGALEASPAAPEAAVKAVTRAVEALMAVYAGTTPDPAAAMETAASALMAAACDETEGQNLAEPDAGQAPAPPATAARPAEPLPPPENPLPAAGGELPAVGVSDSTAAPQAQPAWALPLDADLGLVAEYVTECLDHITAGEGALLELEVNPTDTEQINRIFRAFHTIKGTSGFLGLDRIQRVAHLAENLLDRARSGEVQIVGGYADLALRSCDALRTMIESLKGAAPGEALALPAGLTIFWSF